MADFTIPCETVVRLSHILSIVAADAEPHFHTIRIEDGLAIVTNKKVMVVEKIGGPDGVVHLIVSPELLAQCVTETAFASSLTIVTVDALKFATAKTTLGYIHPGNCALWRDGPVEFDRWREIVARLQTRPTAPNGGMMWYPNNIAAVGNASPSGTVIFEEIIDINASVIVRDLHDPNWFGVFNPYSTDDVPYSPATLPGWAKF